MSGRGRTRVHFDATRVGGLLRSLCGWTLNITTETHADLVTCKTCQQMIREGREASAERVVAPGDMTGAALIADVASVLPKQDLKPKAGPPPRLTAPVWGSSCKGAEHRRCGSCELCEWERSAALWGSQEVSAWNRQHRLQRSADATRWSSLAAALCALAEFERHGRVGQSASGGILARIELGPIDGIARADDPMMRRGGELVRVRMALDAAYPDGAHRLPSAVRKALLLARTPGVIPPTPDNPAPVPTYEQLAEELASTVGELRALVRAGRQSVTSELSGRGLIPEPRPARRGNAGASSMQSEAEAV